MRSTLVFCSNTTYLHSVSCHFALCRLSTCVDYQLCESISHWLSPIATDCSLFSVYARPRGCSLTSRCMDTVAQTYYCETMRIRMRVCVSVSVSVRVYMFFGKIRDGCDGSVDGWEEYLHSTHAHHTLTHLPTTTKTHYLCQGHHCYKS